MLPSATRHLSRGVASVPRLAAATLQRPSPSPGTAARWARRALASAAGTKSDVVVVGSCMIDMIAYTPRLPKLGETLHGTDFQTGFGGKGANQAVQAAKLGARTAMLAKLGADHYGADTVANFNAHGIDTTHVHTTDAAPSGVAPITVDKDGNNCIIIVAGANLHVTEAEVLAAKDVIQSAKVVVCQLEITNEATRTALQLAREAGVTTIFNPAPARPDLEDDLIELADIFCPNETETELLTGMPTTTVEECVAAARVLLRRGARGVLLTLGGNGSLFVSDATVHHEPADASVVPVDTSGAGDSFLGSLAAFLARGHSIPEAMQRAGVVAEASVQGRGTQSSYASKSDLPASLFE